MSTPNGAIYAPTSRSGVTVPASLIAFLNDDGPKHYAAPWSDSIYDLARLLAEIEMYDPEDRPPDDAIGWLRAAVQCWPDALLWLG